MKASILSWVAACAFVAAAFAQAPVANPDPAATQPKDGFLMINGALYESRNGQLQPVTRELTLRISPTGVVTGFDGRSYAIPAGVLLVVDARGVPFTGALPPLVSLPASNAIPGLQANPVVEYPPATRTTIHTGPEVFAVGTSIYEPTTVYIPGVVTVAPLPPVPVPPRAASGAVTTAPATTRGRPVTNNPLTGVAPSAYGVNTTATGNQQNTLGTQQIRPGMGNAVGTGGGPPRR